MTCDQHAKRTAVRRLVVILGDQLNLDAAVFDDFDCECDLVWMAEVTEESTHVWSHKARIAIFLAAMRHFRDELRRRKYKVHYVALDDEPADAEATSDLATELLRAIDIYSPERVVMVEPGEWRLRESLQAAVARSGLPLQMLDDRHFMCGHERFEEHCRGRAQLRMEYFYREMRREHGVLMDGDEPEGGQWNFDSENRKSFSKSGPTGLTVPKKFSPSKTTRQVIKLVNARFSHHPGSLQQFDWPVTRSDAVEALGDFVTNRLSEFGQYQDAMWSDQPVLYHSRLSAALNLKLLSPREVIDAAVVAYQNGDAPLPSVEGFVRQILGWREYVRGVYWRYMPEYVQRNAMKACEKLPEFYWTGETEMECLRQAIGQTLEYGYAHHIQRLMVTGLFALLCGIQPQQVHAWYLAIYVDAVEWVELPNTLGMSQYADGGVMASKPYIASGKYIDRMSNYCRSCAFDPNVATGENACPFTTLYWDYLMRHEDALRSNHRMTMQLKNLQRKSTKDKDAIQQAARQVRLRYCNSEL